MKRLTATRLQRGLRRRLAAMIAPNPPIATEHTAFYPQQPSCQIPPLYHLLEIFLGKRENGHYVEVGAYDGLFVSNTWGLAQRGWHGLLIEPIPYLAEACRRNYSNLDRVEVAQVACAASPGDLTLFLAGTLTSANRQTFSEYADVDWAKSALTSQSVSVRSQALNHLLVQYDVPLEFDLLVVDVEGFESQVFAGFDIGTWKPRMLIVELTDTHPDLTATESEDAQLGRRIVDAGYIVVYKDPMNTVFVREDVWEASWGWS